jgi:hypothetical protein
MEARSVLDDLHLPDDEILGDPELCIAVLDGPVDMTHPCFAGAELTRLDTLVQEPAGQGPRVLHVAGSLQGALVSRRATARGLSMDEALAALSVVEPSRTRRAKAGHAALWNNFRTRRYWRFGRRGLPLSTMPCLTSRAMPVLAVYRRRGEATSGSDETR